MVAPLVVGAGLVLGAVALNILGQIADPRDKSLDIPLVKEATTLLDTFTSAAEAIDSFAQLLAILFLPQGHKDDQGVTHYDPMLAFQILSGTPIVLLIMILGFIPIMSVIAYKGPEYMAAFDGKRMPAWLEKNYKLISPMVLGVSLLGLMSYLQSKNLQFEAVEIPELPPPSSPPLSLPDIPYIPTTYITPAGQPYPYAGIPDIKPPPEQPYSPTPAGEPYPVGVIEPAPEVAPEPSGECTWEALGYPIDFWLGLDVLSQQYILTFCIPYVPEMRPGSRGGEFPV